MVIIFSRVCSHVQTRGDLNSEFDLLFKWVCLVNTSILYSFGCVMKSRVTARMKWRMISTDRNSDHVQIQNISMLLLIILFFSFSKHVILEMEEQHRVHVIWRNKWVDWPMTTTKYLLKCKLVKKKKALLLSRFKSLSSWSLRNSYSSSAKSRSNPLFS